ncbi:hypothetical protein OF83DRAFT_1053322 [Amylostereum chailletii]|nr:hypothetical protein OF83DRAFT_1053322 [Amylostereum chailletii]
MKLLFLSDDPMRTTLASPNGQKHYRVLTKTPLSSLQSSKSQVVSLRENTKRVVGEITWGSMGRKTMVRSDLFQSYLPDGTPAAHGKVDVNELLYHTTFARSRSFTGQDMEEYKWKFVRTCGHELIHIPSGAVKALYNPFPEFVPAGLFKGRALTSLTIHPTCTLNMDIVVLTLIIVEKKRRDILCDPTATAPEHDEDPVEAGVESGMA